MKSSLPFFLKAAVVVLCFFPIASYLSPARAQVQATIKTRVNPKDGLTYVWIRPGTFRMGCSRDDSECQIIESPAHSVKLTRGFWIGQTPVTQAAYKKVVSSNPSSFKGNQLPVETVSWVNAQAYCKSTDMRLPTEAEWEYAARGDTMTSRYAPLDRIAWYNANSVGTTHEVAQKQANAYGLYDMMGNVFEWVADWYGPYDAAVAVDPKGPRMGRARVLRGVSWNVIESGVRVSLRNAIEPGDHGALPNLYGFRCARN